MENGILEELKEKYKLSHGEHEERGKRIKDVFLKGKTPVEKPIAIFDFAPPGSGKTRLNGYGVSQFPNNNVVVINSDELKPFHPKKDEIARLYPQYYTKITDQESNPWTDELLNEAINGGYNIIYEGTGKNRRVIETMETKMQRYRIIVRGMAVNELNCLMSILERYKEQVAKRGWGRLVTVEHFYKAYDKMPETIGMMEQLYFVNEVEIYHRGEGKIDPIRIYASDEKQKRFPNAQIAVIAGRDEDKKNAIKCYKATIDRLEDLCKKDEKTEEAILLRKIKTLYEELTKKEIDTVEGHEVH